MRITESSRQELVDKAKEYFYNQYYGKLDIYTIQQIINDTSDAIRELDNYNDILNYIYKHIQNNYVGDVVQAQISMQLVSLKDIDFLVNDVVTEMNTVEVEYLPDEPEESVIDGYELLITKQDEILITTNDEEFYVKAA